MSRWKSHTAISEWQIHTQEHSWDRTTTLLALGCCCVHLASLQPPLLLRVVRATSSKCDLWPDTFVEIYSTSAHRRRRCGVGCCGCCCGKNHLRMPAPPLRCRLLALEYKPRSCSPARPPRRHDFTRLRTDFQPPNFGRTCLIWGSFVLFKNTKIIRQNENLNHFLLTTFQCGFLCSCRPSPVLSAHPVLRARAYSDWSPLTVPRTRARTVVFLQIGNCTSYHRTVRASR